jgi:uncharacterized OsmC-like protein
MTTGQGSYSVTASTNRDGTSTITANGCDIVFSSSPKENEHLPGPVELLLASFSACVLKNVERFGELLPFTWRDALIEVHAERQESPPRVIRIQYLLTIDTDEPLHRVELLHQNIVKHGTIFNTLASACPVEGTVVIGVTS